MQGVVRRGPLLYVALFASLAAAVMYLAVLPAVFGLSAAYGLVLGALGVAQLVAAVMVVIRPRRVLLLLAAGAALAVVVLWALAGVLPAPDPWVAVASSIGFADTICTGLELIAALVLGVLAAVRRPWRIPRPVRVLAAVPLAVVVVLATVVGIAASSTGSGLPPDDISLRDLPAGQRSTVEYCRPDRVPLAMDLYLPAGTADGRPVALYIHGGGFILGNRNATDFGGKLANHDGALFDPLRQRLNALGFVVASIDYRLPPATSWPAPVEDAKCAVRFLRAHASDLRIDPDRIGVWGSSAGGQISCLLGLTGPAAGFDTGQYADRSSAVQAVVDMFGCIDLDDVGDSSPVLRFSLQLTFGGSTERRRAASPAGYIHPGVPPFLILQGADDPAARPRHTAELERRLRSAGVPVTRIEVRGTGHTLNTPGQQPSPQELTDRVVAFFTATLR